MEYSSVLVDASVHYFIKRSCGALQQKYTKTTLQERRNSEETPHCILTRSGRRRARCEYTGPEGPPRFPSKPVAVPDSCPWHVLFSVFSIQCLIFSKPITKCSWSSHMFERTNIFSKKIICFVRDAHTFE